MENKIYLDEGTVKDGKMKLAVRAEFDIDLLREKQSDKEGFVDLISGTVAMAIVSLAMTVVRENCKEGEWLDGYENSRCKFTKRGTELIRRFTENICDELRR